MPYNNPNQQEAFNVHLEAAKTTLLMLGDYMRFAQEENFDQMLNCLQNIVDFNCAKIDHKNIDKIIYWLRVNKDYWCVRDNLGTILKVNTQNKNLIIMEFQKAYRAVVKELHNKGITHKHAEDPGHAMSKFDT